MENRKVILLEKHIHHGEQGQLHSWMIHASGLVSMPKAPAEKEVQVISLVDEPIYFEITGSQQPAASI